MAKAKGKKGKKAGGKNGQGTTLEEILDAVEGSVPCVRVKDCPRCGGEHWNLDFKPLDGGGEAATHWADCPETGSPILLTVAAKIS